MKFKNQTFCDFCFIILNFLWQTERKEQHLTPGKFTPLKLPDGIPEEEGPAVEFSRHRLRVVEKMGEGSFGMVSGNINKINPNKDTYFVITQKKIYISILSQVHLCETEGLPEFNGVSSFYKKQVIVKSLWRGCGDTTK